MYQPQEFLSWGYWARPKAKKGNHVLLHMWWQRGVQNEADIIDVRRAVAVPFIYTCKLDDGRTYYATCGDIETVLSE